MVDPRCEFTSAAEEDLIDIVAAIADDSPRLALRFTSELRVFCENLAFHPQRYRLREEYGTGVRIAIRNPYLIFYAIQNDSVVIERIVHGARHLDHIQM